MSFVLISTSNVSIPRSIFHISYLISCISYYQSPSHPLHSIEHIFHMPFPTFRATQFCILYPILYFLFSFFLSFYIFNNTTTFPKRISRLLLSPQDKEIPRDKSSDMNTDEIRLSQTTLKHYPLGRLSVTLNEV